MCASSCNSVFISACLSVMFSLMKHSHSNFAMIEQLEVCTLKICTIKFWRLVV